MIQTRPLAIRIAASLLLAAAIAALQPRVLTGGDPLAWALSLGGAVAAALLVAGMSAVLLRHSQPARVAATFVVSLWSAVLLSLLLAWSGGFGADAACANRALAQGGARTMADAGGCPDDSPPDDDEMVQFASLTPDEAPLGTHVAVLVRRIHEGRAAQEMVLPVDPKPAALSAQEAAAIRGGALAPYDAEDFILRHGYGVARKGAHGHRYYAAVHRQSPRALALYEVSAASLRASADAQSMCELLRRGVAQQLKREAGAAPQVDVSAAGQEQEVMACAMRYRQRGAAGTVLAYAALNDNSVYIVYVRAERGTAARTSGNRPARNAG